MSAGRKQPERIETSANLKWPPTRDDLERMYLNEHLSAMKISAQYGLKYENPKCGETLILYHLRHRGIARRGCADHVRKVTKEMVDEWARRYESGESLNQIAAGELSPVTVFSHLRKRGMKLRDKVEAQIKAVTKHQKRPFSGDPLEKSYMLGYARGDLWIGTHGRAIRARTSTTHPAMLEVFTELFSKYGPIYEYPRKCELTGFEWSVDADLDTTFEFLKQRPEEWLSDKSKFLSFLAGFFDAEGSILYHKKGLDGAFELMLPNLEVGLLQTIAGKLNSYGLHPKLRLQPRKNDLRVINGYVVRASGQIWRIEITRYAEVKQLLQELPLRHREKVHKAAIALKMPYEASSSERAGVLRSWSELIQRIEDEVRASIRTAAELCLDL